MKLYLIYNQFLWEGLYDINVQVFRISSIHHIHLKNYSRLTLCVRSSRIRDRHNLTRAYDGHESVTHRVRQENTAVTNL